MFKVIVETQENIANHSSDIIQIINNKSQNQSNLEMGLLQKNKTLSGNIHLFRNMTTQFQKLFYQRKSRVLLITNCFPGLENILQQNEGEIQLWWRVRKNIMIENMSIGEGEDYIVIFKSIAVAQQIYNSIKVEEEHIDSFSFYIQEFVIYSETPVLPQELYKKLILDEEGQKQIWMQIPTCVLCLNLLEQEVTGTYLKGVQKIKEKANLKLCKVCWLMSKGQASCPQCYEKEDNWICMICAAIGCGRYKNADAYKHYIQTKHFLSLDLQTYRIWNYKQDCFSHKVLQKQQQYMDMSEGNQNMIVQQQNLQSAFWKYCCVVSEQLEKQRNFYKKIQQDQLNRLEEEERNIDEKFQEMMKLKQEKTQLLKKKMKKNKKIEKKQRQLEERCAEQRIINISLQQSAKSEHIMQESRQLQRKRKQLQEVEDKICQILSTLN